jgi:hypothetical protein
MKFKSNNLLMLKEITPEEGHPPVEGRLRWQ